MNFQVLVRKSAATNPRATLVFLPYFGGSAHSWDYVWPHLPADFRCLALDFFAPDLPLGADANGDYHVEVAAAQIAEFLEKTVENRLFLIGHSMGGKIALGAAPALKNLAGIVLVAPSPPTPEPMDDLARAFMLRDHGTRAAALEIVKSASFLELDDEKIERAISDNLATPQRDWENWINLGTRQDISAVLSEIRVPVLVIAGARDSAMTPEILRAEIVEKLPDARLEMVESGHLIPLETPDELARLIGEFITD